MIPVGKLKPQPWFTAAETQAVIAALTAEGAEARFVGGCVRDAVLGRPVKDVDIATGEPPAEVMRLLDAAGIKVIPTGIDHGTVTAVLNHAHYEITTLRVDVESHGRHATVAFTDDWMADASRRDFTINALFAGPDGLLYDPFGGLADLGERTVRFVGDPERRIREDVLRLLRFFRFFAWYGTAPADAGALAACAELSHLLPTLSGERVAGELLRLLGAPDPAPVLALMAGDGVLAHVLPEAQAIDRLAALVTVEGICDGADPLRRLAVTLETDAAGADAIGRRLKMSNAQRARLVKIAVPAEMPEPDAPERAHRAALYRLGAETYRDLVLRAWAEAIATGVTVDRRATEAWQAAYALPERWTPPAFPLKGRDARAFGVSAGPRVGELLEEVEAWWREGNFAADREACLAELRRRATA